jgi:3-hydroxyacyl-CoA dehydrogenase
MAADSALGPVRVEPLGGVLVVLIDAGPGNPLTAPVRAALAAALADPPPGLQAVAVLAEGRDFARGDELLDLADAAAAPGAGDLALAVETCRLPVTVGVQGRVAGAGLALALAARRRILAEGARLGFPEVGLGRVPAGGITQRLARLARPATALRLMREGGWIAAATAREAGLADAVVPAAGLAEAVLAAAAQPAAPPAARDRDAALADPRAWMAAVAAARAAPPEPTGAAARIADCVEAGLILPFAQALAFEAAADEDQRASEAAAALARQARTERRLARSWGTGLPAQSVAVAGSGPEGRALARLLLGGGCRVTLVDRDPAALGAALEAVALAEDAAVAAGEQSEAARAARWARLFPGLAEAAGDERPDLLFLADDFAAAAPPAWAAAVLPGGVTVTLGAYAGGPGVGLILAQGGPLAEVVEGPASDPGAPGAVARLLRRTGRLPVAVRGRGIVAPMLAALVAAGRHLAARHGAPAVEAVLARWRLASDPPAAAEGDIGARLRGALANAGMRLLGDGAARSPAEIDLALAAGLGWPRHVPGPMAWAADRGLIVLRADLRAWAEEAPDLWRPAPLIDRMIHDGTRLATLDP